MGKNSELSVIKALMNPMVNVVATLWYDIVTTSETDVVTNFILDVYTMW